MVRHGRDYGGVGALRPLISVMINARKYSLSPSDAQALSDSDASLLQVIKHIAFYAHAARCVRQYAARTAIATPLASPPLTPAAMG
jgi:hypothetical protein